MRLDGARFAAAMKRYAAQPQRDVRVFYVGRLMICWFGRRRSARSNSGDGA